MRNELEDISTHSEGLHTVLNQVPSKLIRYGNLILLILILLLIVLSWTIKYPDIISAEAYITTPVTPQKIYANTNARIDTILVDNKQYIGQNSYLAILENSGNNRDIVLLKSIIDTIAFNKENVYFPFNELPILMLGDIDVQFSEFEDSYFQYKIHQELKPYTTQINIDKMTNQQLINQLNNLISQQATNKKKLNVVKTDLNRYEELLEKGVISQQDYESKQLNYFEAQQEYENNQLTIFKIKESIANAKSDTKTLEFIKDRDEVQLLKRVLQSYNQLKKSLRDWEIKYVLKSNKSGQVSFLQIWDTNITVSDGDLLFTVSEENNPHYLAKLLTPKINAGKIKIGQQVQLKLNDYPEYEFGVLVGYVKNITNVSNNNGSYNVYVEIPKELKTSFGKQITFKQDMQCIGDIVTEDLRLIERLFYQFRSLYNR